MNNNEKHLFENTSSLPICLQQAKFVIPTKFIYGVPIQTLKTKEHRVITYYKPISKLF